MKVYDFDNYKEFVRTQVKAMPKKGRGQFLKMAQHLRVQPTLISQIFRGQKNLTVEQACDLCEFLGLNELETEFFLALVELERAGSENLRKAYRRRVGSLKRQALQLANRMPKSIELTEENKAVFYSNWYYSGIRMLTSISKFQNADSIAEHLGLQKVVVNQVLDFLVGCGLCVEEEGHVRIGPQRTYLSAHSPLITRHHVNWRLKAIEHLQNITDHELAFTSPLSISFKDGHIVRAAIVELIEKVGEIVEKTEPEKAACLTIDWFDL